MARTVAPLLSFEGSGQIAQTQVYASWKGRPYVRRYTVPSNPQTAEQTLTRNTFSFLTNVWKYWPGSAVAAWQLYADSLRITDRNAFLKQNLSPLREETDLLNMVMSPSARSGIAAAAMVLTPGNDQITATLTAPSLPTGWTITAAWAAAVENQNPQADAFYVVTAATDASAPYAPVITGLKDATEYLVGGWFQYLRPDGLAAYGASLQDTATTT